MLSSDTMRQMWPLADNEAPGLVDAVAGTAAPAFEKYGLTSTLLVAHAMAQFSHECGAATELVENLNYSACALMNTWPSRFNATKAAAFAHKPQQIANEVYNGRMGNRTNSDDGWTYRGRGGSQLTGRENYTRLGEKLGLDLANNPDLVNSPQHFLECALADFIMCDCLRFAAEDDVSGVTYHLNGGLIGLRERTAWLAQWKSALNGHGPVIHGTVWVQRSLNQLGAEPPLVVDGSYGPATVMAVKSFQQQHSLQVDGKCGEHTVAAIEQALGG